jgi:uncharacterized protein
LPKANKRRNTQSIMPSLVCPTCRRTFEPADSPAMPFCSERCRLIDLGRWADERYAVPIDPSEEGSEPPPDGEEGE